MSLVRSAPQGGVKAFPLTTGKSRREMPDRAPVDRVIARSPPGTPSRESLDLEKKPAKEIAYTYAALKLTNRATFL